MNPRNKVLEKRGLETTNPGTGAQQDKKFNFDNSAQLLTQPPKELDPVLQQKLDYYNSPSFVRTTSTVFPDSLNLVQRTAFPCAAFIQPFLNV